MQFFSNTFKTVAPQNVTERTRKAKSIEVQLISQIQPKRSFRAFSVLRYPNHFLLAGVQHC